MKTITRNIGSTIIVVIICLIIYTISMVVNPLRINNRLYNGLDSKMVYALSFVNLLGYPDNIFKSPLTIEDYEVPIEGDANTVNDSTSSTLVSDGISYTGSLDELKSKVETALGSSNESMVSSKKKVLAEIFIGLISGKPKDWAYPMSLELASGVLGNTAGEGSSLTVESVKRGNDIIKFKGDGIIKTWKDMEEAYTKWSGGTGIFGFTTQDIKDGVWKHIKSELDKNNINYNDKADEGYAARLQTEGFLLMGSDSLKKKIGFFTDLRWYAMKFDFPSSYSGDFKSPTISNNIMYEVYCDWFCYHYERNAASLSDRDIANSRKYSDAVPVVDETSNGRGIFKYKVRLGDFTNSYNNKSRRMFSKAIYDALKSIDGLSNKTVSTNQQIPNGTLSNSSITSVNPGDYVWVGDSRTMQIINNDYTKKFVDVGGKADNYKLKYGTLNLLDKDDVDRKLTMLGVGSAGFYHMNNGVKDEAKYKADFRDDIDKVLNNTKGGNIIIWIGINMGVTGMSEVSYESNGLNIKIYDKTWIKSIVDSLASKNNKLYFIQIFPDYNKDVPLSFVKDSDKLKLYRHQKVNETFKKLARDNPNNISYIQLWSGPGLEEYKNNWLYDNLHFKREKGDWVLNNVLSKLGLKIK